jgi:hypothetical protein
VRAHHINTDGFSLRTMLAEVAAEYAAPCSLAAAPPAIPPWMVPQRDEQDMARRAAWRARLEARPLPPPLFRVAPSGASGYASGVVPFSLTPDVASRLAALSRERGVTLFTTLLAGLLALLRATTGRDDLPIVTPVENRSWPGAERCVGFLANHVVIRASLAAALTFDAVLARTWDAMQEAWNDEAFLAESLAHLAHAELGQDPTAFLQVTFFFDEYMRPDAVRKEELEWAPLPSPSRAAHAFREVIVAFSRSDHDGLDGVLQYKRQAMDDSTAAAFARAYAELLTDVATGSGAELSCLGMGMRTSTDAHTALPTLHVAVDDGQRRPMTEVTASFIVAGAPDVRPLSEARDMVEGDVQPAARYA